MKKVKHSICRILRYFAGFKLPSIRMSGVRSQTENAPHTDSETYPDLKAGTRLDELYLVLSFLLIRARNFVGRTVNDDSSLNITFPQSTAVQSRRAIAQFYLEAMCFSVRYGFETAL